MANNNEHRQKALDEALKKIERTYGKASVMKMDDKIETEISTVPSGSASINAATPPFFCASAIACKATVVLPEDSGP